MSERRTFEVTEYHEHPEGSDRGGTLIETHYFVIENGKVTHNWSHDYPGDCEDFGVDDTVVERLTTQQEAVDFLRQEAETLKAKYELALERLKLVREAYSYEDETERYPE